MKAKKAKALKTITLGYGEDDPAVSICPGHVTATAFNKAWKAEGWDGGRISKADIFHEYWRPFRKGWRKCEETHKQAQPFTASYW
jgi:hypothetical protein